MAVYDELGRQVPDQVPVEVSIDLKRPLTLQEEIRRFVRRELSVKAAAAELETFEEADDFEVDEDAELYSPYELLDMAPEGPGDASDLSGEEKPLADLHAGKSPGTADPPPAKPVPASDGSPPGGEDGAEGVEVGSPGLKRKPG